MAGYSMGAAAPASLAPNAAPQRLPNLVPASTRTRRNHGVFQFGNELAAIHSTRRESDGLGVTLTIDSGTMVLTGRMTPCQARAVAHAMQAAAQAADEATHSRQGAERATGCAAVVAARQAEGGAA